MQQHYTTKEAAAELGLAERTIRQLIANKHLASEKKGRDHLISKEGLERFKQNPRQGRGGPGHPRKKKGTG